MKKVFWLTGSNFFDVDEKLVPEISKSYDVYWCIIVQKDSYYKSTWLKKQLQEAKIKGSIIDWPRLRTLKSFLLFLQLTRKIANGPYDLIYIDFLGMPYMFPLFYLYGLHKKKIIYACHDFIDHVEIDNRNFISEYKKFVFKRFPYYQLFSETQLRLFLKTYNKQAYYAPLVLKGFGEPTTVKHANDKTVFLFFGRIQERKGLEYLIKAANLVNEKYRNKFVVRICGECSCWEKYNDMIKYPECFNLDIRRIENDEIPNIFNSADYLVLPYKDVTQSGPLLIAYNYQVPVIASKHPGFEEYIDNGKTGFIFENRDENSLATIMSDIIEKKYDYQTIKTQLIAFIKGNVSLESIVKKYVKGFEMVLNDSTK